MARLRHTCELCNHRVRRTTKFIAPGKLLATYICDRCITALRVWISNLPVPGSGDS